MLQDLSVMYVCAATRAIIGYLYDLACLKIPLLRGSASLTVTPIRRLHTMAKLQDMFTQARRAQNAGGMGFLGKNKSETKPRAAALVVEFPTVQPGGAEAVLKAGADGLLFTWDGKNKATL